MAVEGQDKVIAAAQHIVKSLATSKNAADDMIRILSRFDNRLSSIHDLFPPPPSSSSSSPLPPAAAAAAAAVEVILRWDASPDALVWDASPEAAAEYLAAVDAATAAEGGGGADAVVQLAMARLEDEFQHLMVRSTVPLDANGLSCSIRRLSLSFGSDGGESPVADDLDSSAEFDQQHPPLPRSGSVGESANFDDQNAELVRPEAISDLKEIADRMIRARYGRELGQVYTSVRRDILDECLSILGVDRMSIEEVQRLEWKYLDEKMKKWIQGLKLVIRVLLSGERRLCDQIFASDDDLREECFVETTKGCVMQLLNFGDAIAICPRSSEKLFRILDMYEALADVMPNLRALFSSDDFICGEAEGTLSRLGDAVLGTLLEFGNAVRRETSRRPMQAGEIHPITRYVMNYLRLLVVYSETLDLLLNDSGVVGVDGNHNELVDSDDIQNLGSMTPFGRRLFTLISYLETNLEEKSKLYEDGAMGYIFLMNNILYIFNKVNDSELGRILGDNWIRRRRGKIRQYSTSYLRISWTKTLSYLRDDGFGSGSGSGSSHGSGSRMTLKDRFRSFNLAFEEIYRTQTTWKVPDVQLREELKISISEKVIPAYRFFMGRFGGQLDGGRHATRYIKYTAEDLENNISDLFEGLPGLTNHPRRRV
ncbi:exocyst complex component EXO70B1 [Ananas comosus]|uniref:Exocyst subunit Exo70 family protein n=1 Tax=Ananas comosus TaxID=4615 RepID=A0A6P5H1F9_ANACO|nr:exocyst complex component EXO70B1 [Ananas comosus]